MNDLPPPKKLKLRPSKTRESQIETKVCEYAKTLGFLAYKFTSPNRMSVPDRIFISPTGWLFFVEFKSPGGKPTDKQSMEIDRLVEHEQAVYIIDTIADGMKLIDYYDRKGPCPRVDTPPP